MAGFVFAFYSPLYFTGTYNESERFLSVCAIQAVYSECRSKDVHVELPSQVGRKC